MPDNEETATEEQQPPEETPDETTPEEPAEKPEGEGDDKPEAEAKDGEKDGAEEPQDKAETEAKPDDKHRRKGGWERRIEKLEREREILLEQLGRRPGQPAQNGAPAKEKTPEEKSAEYLESLVDQRLAARDAQQKQLSAQAEFQRRRSETAAAHPDFDEALLGVSHVPVPRELQEVLLTSEAGPEIMYQLAKNPAELVRISALPPLEAAREIGRLEARASSTAAPKTPTKSAIRPPAPPTSVGGKTSSSRSLDDLPLADYKRAYRSGRR